MDTAAPEPMLERRFFWEGSAGNATGAMADRRVLGFGASPAPTLEDLLAFFAGGPCGAATGDTTWAPLSNRAPAEDALFAAWGFATAARGNDAGSTFFATLVGETKANRGAGDDERPCCCAGGCDEEDARFFGAGSAGGAATSDTRPLLFAAAFGGAFAAAFAGAFAAAFGGAFSAEAAFGGAFAPALAAGPLGVAFGAGDAPRPATEATLDCRPAAFAAAFAGGAAAVFAFAAGGAADEAFDAARFEAPGPGGAGEEDLPRVAVAFGSAGATDARLGCGIFDAAKTTFAVAGLAVRGLSIEGQRPP